MRDKFCPKCGKSAEKFYDNLCRDCFLGKVSVIEKLPDKVSVKICKSCGKFFMDDKGADSLYKALDIALKDILERPEIASASYRVVGSKLHVNIVLKIQDAQKSEEKIMLLYTKNVICNLCSLKTSSYYRAIIQLRSSDKMADKVLREIEKRISSMGRRDKFAFISKIEKTTGGYDVYVGSKAAVNQVAKEMRDKYDATTKISSKASGFIKGKTTYKNTVLISIE